MQKVVASCVCLLLGCSSSEPSIPLDAAVDGGSDSTADSGELCTYDGRIDPAPKVPNMHTPRWAFKPWISKDISDGPDTYAFVKGFTDRDIPVGTVVLDSPWETHYNTFIPNPKRYPDFGKMVADLRKQEIRTVLWVTQMVNNRSYDLEEGGDKYDGESPNYPEGAACGFFVNDGGIYGWWKGTGAGVDFFNDKARTWWHRQQHAVLDLGIAGWKLDFGESYIDSKTVKTAKGEISHQEYSEKYYEDFWSYGVSIRGPEEFVTMVRPWDGSYGFAGRFFARKEHAPVAWVGDNRRDWLGLIDALDSTFRSVMAGYVVVGSDIGGYLDRDDKTLVKIPADTLVFARWTAMSALMPFMQLHGRANLSPWTVPDHVDETVQLYRFWSKFHTALVPYLYALAEEAYSATASTKPGTFGIVRPLEAAEARWPNDFSYNLGAAFLVAPILDATGKRDVPLPVGERFVDWWAQDKDPVDGKKVSVEMPDRSRIPLYLRQGAIVPLDVEDDVNGLGTKDSKGKLTVLIWPSTAGSSFTSRDEDGATTVITAKEDPLRFTVGFSRLPKVGLIRIRTEKPPATIQIGGITSTVRANRAALDAAADGNFYEPATRSVWVKLPAGSKQTIEVTR